jgi:hypothetical protein
MAHYTAAVEAAAGTTAAVAVVRMKILAAPMPEVAAVDLHTPMQT